MEQYLDGMVDFAEWLVEKKFPFEAGVIAMAMACFCEEKFGGTKYDGYVEEYLK